MLLQLPIKLILVKTPLAFRHLLANAERKYREQDWDGAINLLKEALAINDTASPAYVRAVLHNHLAIAYEHSGLHNLAVEHYMKSLDSFDPVDQTKELAIIHANLGNLYFHENKWKETTYHFKVSADLFSKSGELEASKEIEIRIREVKAARKQMEALGSKIREEEECPRPNQTLSHQLAIARAYARAEEWDRAFEAYGQALQLCERLCDDKQKAIILNDQASVVRFLDDIEKAVSMYKQALALGHKCGDVKTVSVILNNLGLAYKELGRLSKAIEHFEQSLKMKERMNNKTGLGNTLYNLASLHLDIGELSKARQYIESAIAVDTQRDSDRIITNKDLLEKIRNVQGQS